MSGAERAMLTLAGYGCSIEICCATCAHAQAEGERWNLGGDVRCGRIRLPLPGGEPGSTYHPQVHPLGSCKFHEKSKLPPAYLTRDMIDDLPVADRVKLFAVNSEAAAAGSAQLLARNILAAKKSEGGDDAPKE